MKWIPVLQKEDVPQNDAFEDYPMQYILKCKNDGSRGDCTVYQVESSAMWNKAQMYDYAAYLDESDTERIVFEEARTFIDLKPSSPVMLAEWKWKNYADYKMNKEQNAELCDATAAQQKSES